MRRFALGRVLKYAMMVPWLISLDIMHKLPPLVDIPSNGSMFGWASFLQITTSVQNLCMRAQTGTTELWNDILYIFWQSHPSRRPEVAL